MKLSHRILRFAAVGSACFILQYCLMKIFSGLMPLYFAEVIGFMFSAQANFALSQIFTWADRKHAIDYLMRWVKFNVSSLASVLIVNATVFWLLTSLGSWMWLSLLSANAASTAFTFVMNHFVVFRNKPLAGQDVAPTGEAPTPVSSVSLFMPAHNEGSKAHKIRMVVSAPFPMDLIVRTPETMKWRLEEGDSFLREITSKGKVLYEKADGGVGAKGRGRLSGRGIAPRRRRSPS